MEVVPGAGRLRYVVSPDHRHWHLLGFDRYELRRAGRRAAAVSDRKTGFCLGDRYPVTGRRLKAAPPSPSTPVAAASANRACIGIQEGISVGYGDDYQANLEGQYLPLTGLPSGPLRARAPRERGPPPARAQLPQQRGVGTARAALAARRPGRPAAEGLPRHRPLRPPAGARRRWRARLSTEKPRSCRQRALGPWAPIPLSEGRGNGVRVEARCGPPSRSAPPPCRDRG